MCASVPQDKEIYRWPIKESVKAMIAWEWTLEKARDGEEEKAAKITTRKISQTAQVEGRMEGWGREEEDKEEDEGGTCTEVVEDGDLSFTLTLCVAGHL